MHTILLMLTTNLANEGNIYKKSKQIRKLEVPSGWDNLSWTIMQVMILLMEFPEIFQLFLNTSTTTLTLTSHNYLI